MNEVIRILLPEDLPAYEPRQELVGTLAWKRARPFAKLQLHLLWFTSGRGDADSSVVETLEWDQPGSEGERFFEIRLPRAPYTLKSDNLEIHWQLEAIGQPGNERTEIELVIAPGRERLELKSVDHVEGPMRKLQTWLGVGRETASD